MKSTLFVGSLIATSVLATPVVEKLNEKRSYFTVTEVDTVYATVTGSPDSGWGWWDGWHGSPGSTVAAVTTTTEEAPVPVVTETPVFTMPAFTPPPPAPVETPPPAPAPVAPSVPTPVPSSPSQGTGPGGVDIGAILDQHNLHRQNASVPSLTWSDDMASIAAEIAASCTYAHNTQAGGGGYGQNIGAGAPPQDVPAMITNEMYNGEINFYPLPYGVEPDMSNFESWGHYSQIVWKNTVSVGCAVQDCSATGLSGVGSGVSAFFSVCNYSPPGNFGGEYGANVLAPDGGLASETVPN